MDKQNGKVDHEEVREDHAPALGLAWYHVLAVAVLEKVGVSLGGCDGVLGSVLDYVSGHGSRQDVRPAHDPVAEVVDVAGHSPPAAHQELGASGRLNILEVLDARVFRVGPEAVLLVVHSAENVVSNALDGQDASHTSQTKFDRVDREIACLQRIGERNPDEVTKGKHHAETVSDNIDRGEDGGLHVQGVKGVDSLRNSDENDGVGNTAEVAVLLHDKRKIQDDPSQHSRAKFAPRLDVNFSKDGQGDARVQFTSDEPVVQHVASVATGCKLSHGGVLRVLDTERRNVDIDGQSIGNEDVAGENANVVVVDECPNRKFGALGNGSCAEDGYDEESRVKGCTELAKSIVGT